MTSDEERTDESSAELHQSSPRGKDPLTTQVVQYLTDWVLCAFGPPERMFKKGMQIESSDISKAITSCIGYAVIAAGVRGYFTGKHLDLASLKDITANSLQLVIVWVVISALVAKIVSLFLTKCLLKPIHCWYCFVMLCLPWTAVQLLVHYGLYGSTGYLRELQTLVMIFAGLVAPTGNFVNGLKALAPQNVKQAQVVISALVPIVSFFILSFIYIMWFA